MKLILNGGEYQVLTEASQLVASIEDMAPLKLSLSRSGDHEYYASLPGAVNDDGADVTSHVKAGWLYYFKDWNAFALNFKETDIAPYKVSVIGEVSDGIAEVLAESGANIEIEVER